MITAEEVTTNQLVVGGVHGRRAFVRDTELPSNVLLALVARPIGAHVAHNEGQIVVFRAGCDESRVRARELRCC